MRIYDVSKMLLSVPNFEYKPVDFIKGNALGQTELIGVRKTSDDLAAELLDLIVETIEPEAWEQDEDDYEESDVEAPAPKLTVPNLSDPKLTEAEKRFLQYEYDKARHSRKGKWASVKYWQGKLIVRAPDFLHRQLNGYPKPIPPKGYNGRVKQ